MQNCKRQDIYNNKNVCLRLRIHPSSEILHEQRSACPWHFPLLTIIIEGTAIRMFMPLVVIIEANDVLMFFFFFFLFHWHIRVRVIMSIRPLSMRAPEMPFEVVLHGEFLSTQLTLPWFGVQAVWVNNFFGKMLLESSWNSFFFI